MFPKGCETRGMGGFARTVRQKRGQRRNGKDVDATEVAKPMGGGSEKPQSKTEPVADGRNEVGEGITKKGAKPDGGRELFQGKKDRRRPARKMGVGLYVLQRGGYQGGASRSSERSEKQKKSADTREKGKPSAKDDAMRRRRNIFGEKETRGEKRHQEPSSRSIVANGGVGCEGVGKEGKQRKKRRLKVRNHPKGRAGRAENLRLRLKGGVRGRMGVLQERGSGGV